MLIRFTRQALCAFGALSLVAAPALAAGPTRLPPFGPPIVGTVTDTAGTPLPNAEIIVAEVGRVTTTDATGAFAIRGLPAGVYHLNTLFLGYAPAHVTVTLPDSGPDVRVTIALRPATVRLQSVMVTATPTGTDPLNITQSTVELSGKELAQNIGASVAQTLSREPGMAMRYNGPTANVPVIRGLTGERILVLQDGERAADLSSSSADHGLSIDPLNAQRIEVVRGPASLLYGNNALGGVVNVISNDIPTTVPSHIEGYVGGQAESVNPGGATSVSITAPVGSALAVTARGGYRRIGDVRQGGGDALTGTDSRNFNGTLGLGLVGDRATGGLVYRAFDFDYGLPAAPDDEEQGVRIDGRRQELSGRASVDLGDRPISYLRLDGTAQWYNHDEIERTGAIGTAFNLRTQTLNATGKTSLGPLTGAVGAQGLFKQYSAEGEEALTPAANSRSGGLFLYQELPIGVGSSEANTPRLQFGGRYDVYRIDSKPGDPKFGGPRSLTFDNASGSLGLSVPLGAAASFSASVARAFRAPTVEELFSEAVHNAAGSYDRGNADLRAETNAGVDAVFRVQGARASAQLSGYYNRINDYIYPQAVGDTTVDGEEPGETRTLPLVEYRQADANLRGVEGQVEYEVVPQIVVGAVGDVVRGQFHDGGPLPFIPAARLGGSLRWDNRRYSLGGDVRHGFAQDRVTGGEFDLPTDAYTLVNASAGLNFVAGGYVHSVTLRADNLFDEQYRDATSRIKRFALNPGRNVSVVYRLLF
jgi:iron complex outermembrane receptor protein